MGKVASSMSMSLDGYVTGPHDSREHPHRRHRKRDRTGEAAAGHRAVGLHGATAAQQALAAGLLDEVQVHLVRVLLGGGVRLFDLLGANPVDLVRERVIEAGSGVTHLRFRIPR
jgi:dihydrofolate reductase